MVSSPPSSRFQIRDIDRAFCQTFLADMGVAVIISGGMGGGAVDIFNERSVEVVLGAQGDAKTAVESYLRGKLHSTGSICHEHAHEHECH